MISQWAMNIYIFIYLRCSEVKKEALACCNSEFHALWRSSDRLLFHKINKSLSDDKINKSLSDDRHKAWNSELQQANASFLTLLHRRKALLHSIEHSLPSNTLLQVIIYIFIYTKVEKWRREDSCYSEFRTRHSSDSIYLYIYIYI